MSEETKKVAITLETVLPWWSDFQTDYPLDKRTEESTAEGLNRFFFFPVNEIAVSNSIEDIPKFVNDRYQNILAAAYSAGLSVATLIQGTKGRVNVSFGFVVTESTKKKDNDDKVFSALLKGVFPGVDIRKHTILSKLVPEMPFGGVITGIPALKNDDERQRFNISSVVRSLYGNEYTLLILASPVDRVSMQERFGMLLDFKDQCHMQRMQNITEEIGKEKSTGQSQARTESNSITKGWNVGGGVGTIIPTPIPVMPFISVSRQTSKTKGESDTISTSSNDSEHWSMSRSYECQSEMAAQLEKIADHFVERMIRGFNVGYWETIITFAAKSSTVCDILGGSFIGELSKPSEKLYPPRCYIGEIKSKQFIFLPRIDSASPIFPKSLASYLTSEELSQIASPPTESLPGFEIKKMPSLCLTDIINVEDQESVSDCVEVGHIADYGNPIPGSSFVLTNRDLNKHLFVCGITGSGKTTTVKHILKSVSNRKEDERIPFLVLESAKRDYRQLAADEVFEERLRMYTVGDDTVSPIRLNPFYIQKGIHLLSHIDYLKAIFNASFSLYGPMPHILEKCLHNIYLKRGWSLTSGLHPHFLNENGKYNEDQYNPPEHHYCFPTLTDLKREIDSYINSELGYKGELRDNIRTAIIVRLESLCVGAKGLMFNTYEFHPIEDLLGHPTILEMESLADDDDKAFFVGLMLVAISEYRQKNNPAINAGIGDKGLQHLLVIEEAHRLLKNVSTDRSSEMMGNPRGKAVEVFCNVISEMRSLGQGVVVVEQIPSKIAPDVIKNSNTKIVHRLVAKDDQELLAGSLSLSDDDALYLNRLKTGFALCHKEGMERPVEICVKHSVKSHALEDHRVIRKMQKAFSPTNEPLHPVDVYELTDILQLSGKEIVVRFLNSLCVASPGKAAALIARLQEELRRAVLLKNTRRQYLPVAYTEYAVKNIFELLGSGVYCTKTCFCLGLKKSLTQFLSKPTIEECKAVLAMCKECWNVPDASDFIVEVVTSLAVKDFINQRNKLSPDQARRSIEEYFIVSEASIVNKILTRFENQIGGFHD